MDHGIGQRQGAPDLRLKSGIGLYTDAVARRVITFFIIIGRRTHSGLLLTSGTEHAILILIMVVLCTDR